MPVILGVKRDHQVNATARLCQLIPVRRFRTFYDACVGHARQCAIPLKYLVIFFQTAVTEETFHSPGVLSLQLA